MSKYGFILAMAIIALIALKTPLQHYISLTRYQHVGIAIFVFGMGYVMQSIWSWRTYSKWAKMSNLATGAFFTSVGMFFYKNTWLEEYATEVTPVRYLGRLILLFVYLLLALFVSLFWLKWAHEDNKLKDAEKNRRKQSESGQTASTETASTQTASTQTASTETASTQTESIQPEPNGTTLSEEKES